jgi:hypothetical protein
MCAGGEDDADGCHHFLCLLAALSHILYREEIMEFICKKYFGYWQCCHIMVDSVTASSQNEFCSFALCFHEKTNII